MWRDGRGPFREMEAHAQTPGALDGRESLPPPQSQSQPQQAHTHDLHAILDRMAAAAHHRGKRVNPIHRLRGVYQAARSVYHAVRDICCTVPGARVIVLSAATASVVTWAMLGLHSSAAGGPRRDGAARLADGGGAQGAAQAVISERRTLGFSISAEL